LTVKEVALGSALAVLLFAGYLGYNVLPLLFFGALLYVLWFTVTNRHAGGTQVALTPASRVFDVGFDDIGGQEMAKNELREALNFMLNREAIKRLGIRPLKGILLHGPPGTGKTLLAKAAASYTRAVFLAASGSEFIEVYAGVGAQRVRQLFKRAKEMARSQGTNHALIFIDELEILGGVRGKHSSHLEYDQTLNQLLVEMDGLTLDDDVQIMVLGATNRIDLLDPALLRPGRFDRVVNVELPDKEGRLRILQLHTRDKPLAEDVDLESLARDTFGFSGAHLENLTNEAAIMAMRDGLDRIHQRHLVEAIDKVMMGEKLDRRPTPEELRRIAVHEAGHALVSEVLRPGSVSSVTITSRGSALGYVRNNPGDDRYLETRELLEEEICVLVAGSAAERRVYGSGSSGAASDLRAAVDRARKLVSAGMSELGVVDEEVVPAGLLHRTITGIISEQEGRAEAILAQASVALDNLVEVLVENESLDGDKLRDILRSQGVVA